MEADVLTVGDRSAVVGHRRHAGGGVLGLDGRQDRPPAGVQPDHSQFLAGHRRVVFHPRKRLDLPDAAAHRRRVRRRRALLRRPAAGAGVHAGLETRFRRWPGDRVHPHRSYDRQPVRRLPGARDRLARPVRRRRAAWPGRAVDPHLGAGIAALAAAPGPRRRCQEIARLGAADRSGDAARSDRAGVRNDTDPVPRPVQVSAQPDRVLAGQPGRPDRRRTA